MNDEFLHALRRDPPPEFARELKRRLQHQSAQGSTRLRAVRTLLAVFLIGGVAMAAALLLRDRDEPTREDPPVAQAAAPETPAPETRPAVTPRSNRQVPSITPTQPQAPESGAKDVTLTLITSMLARPLAEALAENLNKGGGGIVQARVMIMDDAEALRALCGNADFVMVSRRISEAELASCWKQGVEVVEWHIGYQAVVLTAGPMAEPAALTPREVFLALARRIPDPADPSRLIDNPNVTWHDVDARFDYRRIDVLVPIDAATRVTFLQLVMEPGCETYPWIRGLKQTDRRRYDNVCHQLRSDDRVHEVAPSNTLVTQQLWAEPNWLVVLGYSYYAAYRAELLGTMLAGPVPTLATLSDGTYPAARPVYVYAQRLRISSTPGGRSLSYELRNEYAVGRQGYLPRHGLVPLDEEPRWRPHQTSPLTLESLQPRQEHPR